MCDDNNSASRSTHRPCPRLRHAIGPWRPVIAPTCIACGVCVQVCPRDVFSFMVGRRHMTTPREENCLGMTACGACVSACPARAITIKASPNWAALGDDDMSNAIIASIWTMAEHGAETVEDPVSVDTRGQGFDRLGIVVPEGLPTLLPGEVSLRVSLHHRGQEVQIKLPIIGSALRTAARSAPLTLARAAAAQALGTFTTYTGGALPPALEPYAACLIIEIAEGFDTESPVTEALLAQAPAIALRPPFADIHALDDLAALFDWLHLINPGALRMVTLDASINAAQASTAAAQAGAHVIHLAGGASPAQVAGSVHAVHRALCSAGLRDMVALVAGGMRTPFDVLKAIALGADAGAVDLVEWVALGGIPATCGVPGTHWPPGVPVDAEWGAQRLMNLHLAWAAEQRRALALLSLPDVHALRGRSDLLVVVEEIS